MSRSGLPGAAILFANLAVSGCTGAPGSAYDGATCSTSTALLGGADTYEPAFIAVGTLGTGLTPESFEMRCTATLIAPDEVLTAKHCIIERPSTAIPQNETFSFGLQTAASEPVRVIPISNVELLEPDAAGYTGFGSDLALCRLSTQVTDVAPIPVEHESLGPADIGARFTVIGFGTDRSDGTSAARSTRRRGAQTLRALDGNLFDHIYGSRSAFMAAAADDMFTTAACSETVAAPEVLEREYSAATLIDGYEAWAGDEPGDAQACRGDSGGPLLRESSSGPQVVGVTSWAWHSSRSACDDGSVYAVFGPGTLDVFARRALR